MGCEDVRRQLSVRQTALVRPNTAQVYFDSNFAYTFVLHVAACTEAILKHVIRTLTNEDTIRM
jgi:hypothetical protein